MVGKAKGGPFIGPRGGKWADAKHTIHWEAAVDVPLAESAETSAHHIRRRYYVVAVEKSKPLRIFSAWDSLRDAYADEEERGVEVRTFGGGQLLARGFDPAQKEHWVGAKIATAASRKRRHLEKKKPLVGKAGDSAGFQSTNAQAGDGNVRSYQEQTMPDYQYIYGNDAKLQARQERRASIRRRRASSHLNAGRYGFHGEPPEPVLRFEPTERVQMAQRGPAKGQADVFPIAPKVEQRGIPLRSRSGIMPRSTLQMAGKAGGPFIGPRGGKWADAKHTIPWRAPTEVRDDNYEEIATALAHRIGLPIRHTAMGHNASGAPTPYKKFYVGTDLDSLHRAFGRRPSKQLVDRIVYLASVQMMMTEMWDSQAEAEEDIRWWAGQAQVTATPEVKLIRSAIGRVESAHHMERSGAVAALEVLASAVGESQPRLAKRRRAVVGEA
jgi:hypothetical protein